MGIMASVIVGTWEQSPGLGRKQLWKGWNKIWPRDPMRGVEVLALPLLAV